MPIARPVVDLALDVARVLSDLHAGRALDAVGRARVIGVLARTLPALAGRAVPVRSDADPAGLVRAAVTLARDAGLSGSDLVAAFNDALED